MATWHNSYNNYLQCRNYNLTRVSQDLKKGLFSRLFLKDGVTDFISEAHASLIMYGYHQRENTGSRLFTAVKPCWTGLISGWVTI